MFHVSQRGGNGRQRAATGGKKRQKAAKGGNGACVSQPCGGKELPVLRLHDTAGMVAPLKGVRTINLGRFRAEKVRLRRGAPLKGVRTIHKKVPRRKSSALPGVSCVPQKCAIKGRSCVIMMRHRRDGCSSKRGAHYHLGRFRAEKCGFAGAFHVHRKSALSRGRSCAEPCGSKGRFRAERRKHSSRF